MRGIAMALVGATMAWLHVALFRESDDGKTGLLSAGIMLAWFAATCVVIAGGW